MSSRERVDLPALTPARVERVTAREWRAACERHAQAGGRFCGLFASGGTQGLQVNCVFAASEPGPRPHARPCLSGTIDTLVDLFAAAGWDEREAHDSYGLRFRRARAVAATAGPSRRARGMDGARPRSRRLSGRGRPDPRGRDRVRSLPLHGRRRAHPAPRPAPVLQAPRAAESPPRARPSPTGCATPSAPAPRAR